MIPTDINANAKSEKLMFFKFVKIESKLAEVLLDVAAATPDPKIMENTGVVAILVPNTPMSKAVSEFIANPSTAPVK
ncbi:hypothetical protein AX774_g2916 [Zancudomyces culisetae]|uniref:Uncharacterized protein n=1 Tax=Zancudomyces culisetae TaxID=1213189 RepID=A0A1R1PRI7_ZANCU|nr:hypothetical protein AX774_g2916 [Zancudomyces culisetae]|eukprot:OMH83577.1 hypothetical protein AX774_g2916 [Zancudomyces culisetae]